MTAIGCTVSEDAWGGQVSRAGFGSDFNFVHPKAPCRDDVIARLLQSGSTVRIPCGVDRNAEEFSHRFAARRRTEDDVNFYILPAPRSEDEEQRVSVRPAGEQPDGTEYGWSFARESIGGCRALGNSAGYRISDVFLHPSCRGKGLAAFALRATVRHLGAPCYFRTWESNRTALSAYRKAGAVCYERLIRLQGPTK